MILKTDFSFLSYFYKYRKIFKERSSKLLQFETFFYFTLLDVRIQ
ncbi:hypothetical protein LX64_04157 [Chitinophaga skermanii]|uniref:Uncharacterized protein n=1 Tax=Chitinophaga skermanii TaxID=331697 RepID=A0A327Q822_9BACT|nr:hypothetical protein LX64_04157 [Chitinophaga skermanii]